VTSRRSAGVLLMGRSGSGKTRIQRRLVNEHGFWAPLHVTTRPVNDTDFATVSETESNFLAAVESGEIAAPMRFGGSWHAWRTEDLRRLCHGEERAVAVCRPYEALLLSALQPRLVPVWLSAPAPLIAERLQARANERDAGGPQTVERRRDDDEDERYRPFFRDVIASERDAVADILRLVGGREATLAGSDAADGR